MLQYAIHFWLTSPCFSQHYMSHISKHHLQSTIFCLEDLLVNPLNVQNIQWHLWKPPSNTMFLFILKYMKIFSYEVIQDFNIHIDKQKNILCGSTSFPAITQTTSTNCMFLFCSIWMRLRFSILLCQLASALGQLHYWNKDRKWKYQKELGMELVEWILERKKKKPNPNSKTKCLWPNFQEVRHSFSNKQCV